MLTSRLFIALYPDDIALEELSQLNISLSPFATLKIIPQNQRHLTLCFLGEIEISYISAIKNVLMKLSPSSTDYSLKFEALEYGANPTHPNLIWLRGNNSPWILDLWQELKKELVTAIPLTILDEQGQKSLMSQHFLSHLTLARFNGSISQNLPPLPSITPLIIHFKSIALIESTLTPTGPVYNVLENIPLKS